VKSVRTAIKRVDSALRKLKKLIDRHSNNKLTKALKYIKAEFPNISHIT
jgi:ribosomal protein S21